MLLIAKKSNNVIYIIKNYFCRLIMAEINSSSSHIQSPVPLVLEKLPSYNDTTKVDTELCALITRFKKDFTYEHLNTLVNGCTDKEANFDVTKFKEYLKVILNSNIVNDTKKLRYKMFEIVFKKKPLLHLSRNHKFKHLSRNQIGIYFSNLEGITNINTVDITCRNLILKFKPRNLNENNKFQIKDKLITFIKDYETLKNEALNKFIENTISLKNLVSKCELDVNEKSNINKTINELFKRMNEIQILSKEKNIPVNGMSSWIDGIYKHISEKQLSGKRIQGFLNEANFIYEQLLRNDLKFNSFEIGRSFACEIEGNTHSGEIDLIYSYTDKDKKTHFVAVEIKSSSLGLEETFREEKFGGVTQLEKLVKGIEDINRDKYRFDISIEKLEIWHKKDNKRRNPNFSKCQLPIESHTYPKSSI